MNIVTRGVVLNTIKYSESSLISKIFTEKYGLQSFIIKGLSGKKLKHQKAYLQALSVVEITSFIKEGKGLHPIRSIKLDYTFCSIPFIVQKSAIAFFLAEALSKLLKNEQTNTPLFSFIINSIKYFDEEKINFINFHIVFLAQLTRFLGIFPNNVNDESAIFFDWENGEFKKVRPNHINFIKQDEAQILRDFFLNSYSANGSLSNDTRNVLLQVIIDYYSYHLVDIKSMKSKEVLSELFS